jgi:hypothetical protein
MSDAEIKNIDYNFINSLFHKGFQNRSGWKYYYFRETQKCFEKHYKPEGRWKKNKKNRWGVYDGDKWSWMNRINTHPNCCLSFYKWAVKYNPEIFIDFGNPDYHEYNAIKMWEFIDQFFEFIFTTKKTKKYFLELKIKCQNSWINGNLTMLAVVLSLKDTFNHIDNIEYTYDYGDEDDMMGIDLSFTLSGLKKTMQIKSGKYHNLVDEFLIKGSANDLEYNTDYFGYAHIDNWTNLTSVIIFENNSSLYKDENEMIVVKKELVKYHKIKNMENIEKINEIVKICGKNNIEFILTKENEINTAKLNIEDGKFELNIPLPEDNNLKNLLDKELNELKQLFN